jgi:hypothetical protein
VEGAGRTGPSKDPSRGAEEGGGHQSPGGHVRLSARPVFLVDVLNELCKVLGIDGSNLWDPPGQEVPPISGSEDWDTSNDGPGACPLVVLERVGGTRHTFVA